MPLDLTVHPQALERAVQRARERGVIVPTFAQQRDPALIPASIVSRLRGVGLWDLDPLNLFRITWHNQPVERGGGYGPVNVIEFPSPLTGVEARIVGGFGHQRRPDIAMEFFRRHWRKPKPSATSTR